MRTINAEDICSHGIEKKRKNLIDILSCGVDAVDPGIRTKSLVSIQSKSLYIGDSCHNLDEIENIYVVGSGKGSYPIVKELVEILGDRITDGVLAVKKGDDRTLERIKIYRTGHPIPDTDSITAAVKIMEVLQKAGEKDLVFAAITGGASAMTVIPPDGISLEDLQITNEVLLKSGATIREMNTVRRHLCKLKGGRLVKYAQPAHVYTITLDTVDEDIMPWPDMSKADPTTFKDAVEVLKTYDLADRIPRNVVQYLNEGTLHEEWETVKSLENMRQTILSVGNPKTACEAAAKKAEQLGYQAHILATHLEGESAEAGIFLAGISNEILKNNRPFCMPCALITGGETTVTINGESGRGGPNMELVLSYVNYMKAAHSWAIASIDTDGTDGPTQYAGAIADPLTKHEIESEGFIIKDQLKKHATEEVFLKTKNIINTGHTGTNVMNLRVVLIGG